MSTSVSHQTTNRIPEPVARLADVMSTFRASWSLCGGWAVNAWLGRQTRDHVDVDITIFQDDQHALFDYLAGWQLIGHDPNVPGNTSEPWHNRHLDLPGHIHGWPPDAQGSLPDLLETAAQQAFSLDVQLCRRSGNDWVIRRQPRICVPVSWYARPSGWGLPTLVPEAVLLYKAPLPRPHDEQDFLALLPQLSGNQRYWLREAILLAHPEHPWLSRLSP